MLPLSLCCYRFITGGTRHCIPHQNEGTGRASAISLLVYLHGFFQIDDHLISLLTCRSGTYQTCLEDWLLLQVLKVNTELGKLSVCTVPSCRSHLRQIVGLDTAASLGKLIKMSYNRELLVQIFFFS